MNEQILAKIKADHNDTGEYYSRYDYEDSDYLEIVEQEEWTQNHKNQYRQTIYWDLEHNCYIAVNESRSGSYHSGWDYDPPDVAIVKKQERVVTKTIVEWVTV